MNPLRSIALVVALGLPVSTSSEIVLASSSPALAKLQVLIVTGQGNHGWRESTAAFEATLKRTGRFDVDVAQSPARRAPQEEWENWHPRFSDYDAVVMNYRGEDWPEALKKSLESYLREGGGMFVNHSNLAAFDGWLEYESMIGLGWNPPGAGVHLIYDEESGEYLRLPPSHGPGVGHGKQHEFTVTTRAPEHPIMQGLPARWTHGKDELYHGMRGPAENVEVLATAYSDKRQWGTADHEPMVWTVAYGEGRVVVTVMGHRFSDRFQYDPARHLVNHGENGPDALFCVGFQTILARGLEWASMGEVTITVPRVFPSSEEVSIVSPEDIMWDGR